MVEELGHIKRRVSPVDIPFSVEIRGRKSRQGIPMPTFLAELDALDKEILALFNRTDLAEAAMGDTIRTRAYEVIPRNTLFQPPRGGPLKSRHSRAWAQVDRRPFRVEYFYIYRFKDAGDIGRIKAAFEDFVRDLRAVIQFDADLVLEEAETLDSEVFDQDPDRYVAEGHVYTEMMNETRRNIRARTAERSIAKLPLPQELRRTVAEYVNTRRRGSAPRIRPLPPALSNAGINAANRRPEKVSELRQPSPPTRSRRSPPKKKRTPLLRRLFTRRAARVAPAPAPKIEATANRFEPVVPIRT